MQAVQPYNVYRAITKSDTVNFRDGACDAIYCGSTGNVVVIMEDTSAVTFTGVFSGEILPVRAIRVNNTNSTGTGLVALYYR